MFVKMNINKATKIPQTHVRLRLSDTDLRRHKQIDTMLMGLRKTGKCLPRGSVPLSLIIWPFVDQLSTLVANASGPVWIRAVDPGAPGWVSFVNGNHYLQRYAAELLGEEALPVHDPRRGEKSELCTSIRASKEQQKRLQELATRMGLPPGQLVRLVLRRWGKGFPEYVAEQEQLYRMVEGVTDWFR
jgi:hypothetical protein